MTRRVSADRQLVSSARTGQRSSGPGQGLLGGAGPLTEGRVQVTVVVIVPELLDGLGSVCLAVAVKLWTTVPGAVMVTPMVKMSLPPMILIPPTSQVIVELSHLPP